MLPRRDVASQPGACQPAAPSPRDVMASPSSDSSASSDSSSPAGGTPAARIRAAAAEAVRRQPCNVGLKLDLSRVLPPGSARQPLFQAQDLPTVIPNTPRGREPVRRQDLLAERPSLGAVDESRGGTDAAASSTTPRSATVGPLTARGAGPGAPPLTARGVPLTARGVPEARSVPPPSQAGGIISCSSARRAGVTPREYLVEVLSPTRALELCTAAATIGGSVPAPWLLNAGGTSARPNEACSPRSPRSPGIGSPPLMLRPRESLNEAAGPPPGNVSTSSSEGDIRARLQQGLRPELRPSSVDAASPKDVKTQVPRLNKFPVLEQTNNQVPRINFRPDSTSFQSSSRQTTR